MNGSSTVNYPINEQVIGKFHVVNLDKLPPHTMNNHDEIITNNIPQIPSIADESVCASRFQMIRVDRNFGRGRWKVNDYEPPENTSISTIPPVNSIENESIHLSNTNIPTAVTSDSNGTSSAVLAAAAASAAAATAAVFQQQQQQQQQQQRLALVNTSTVVPTSNVQPPPGLLHGYPPGALANLAASNQSYLLANHPQFSYYAFYPTHYSPYANSWANALAASNPYLQPPPMAPPQTAFQLPTGNLNDTVTDINGETSMMSGGSFPNPTADHLQNAQLAAAPFLYAAHHSHSPFGPQVSAGTSPYATIPSFHPPPHPPTIIPPNQSLPFSQAMSYNPIDIQQALALSSPKHDITKNHMQHPSVLNIQKTNATFNGINNDPSKSNTHITDLISSSPLLINSQQAPQSLISPLSTTTSTASLSNIWPYTTGGTPLSLTQRAAQTAAVTAVAAMGLLNNENSQNTEIAQEILKELTTPTKQNNFTLLERRTCLRLRRQLSTTDIDNKISAAMDLVKMHLLSAVREEVTELRQQIRTLNEKINSIEHENAFLRQHVPSEIYAQYIPTFIGESINPTTSVIPSIPSILSSQTMPMTSLSSLPSSIAQQASLPTNNSQPLSSLTTTT